MATEQESKTRSERLAEVDVNDLLPKCIKKKTTTKKDFVNHMFDGRIYKPSRSSMVIIRRLWMRMSTGNAYKPRRAHGAC